MFRNGDRVVCICGDDWGDALTFSNITESYDPKKGDEFTVVGAREFEGRVYLYFKEITDKGADGDRECYCSSAFRKLAPHDFTNDLTEELANMPFIEEGIERIIVEPEYA